MVGAGGRVVAVVAGGAVVGGFVVVVVFFGDVVAVVAGVVEGGGTEKFTVTTAAVTFPAGSVAVTVIELTPGTSSTPAAQLPFSSSSAGDVPIDTTAAASAVPDNTNCAVVTVEPSSPGAMVSTGGVVSAGIVVVVGAGAVVATVVGAFGSTWTVNTGIGAVVVVVATTAALSPDVAVASPGRLTASAPTAAMEIRARPHNNAGLVKVSTEGRRVAGRRGTPPYRHGEARGLRTCGTWPEPRQRNPS